MPADPLPDDPRLRLVPRERWERARLVRERGWLRDVRATEEAASAVCAGLVGVRVGVDRRSGAASCECGAPAPCEHALALMLDVGLAALPPPPAPPAEPLPASTLLLTLHAEDPGRIVISRGDGAPVGSDVAELLRWLWWRQDGATLTGEVRTLAQAAHLLAERGHDVRGAGARAREPTSGAAAVFRQRALGDVVTVRLLGAASDAGLALAKLLADRGARPFPGKLPAEVWTVPDEVAFAAWFLLASATGATVSADATLNPRPLAGVEVQLDAGCLPGRLRGPAERESMQALLAFLRDALGGEPTVDTATQHVMLPASRIVAVEDGLRALGADVTYRRLAPPHQRFLQWAEELPVDLFGARPRLRAAFDASVALDAAPPRMKEGVVLADYQKEAVAFIVQRDHTCLLADDMGLGKTLESIAAAQFLGGRVLVVAPASAREVWRREVAKFTLESCAVVGPGDDPRGLSGDEKYVVTGYSNLETLGDAIHPEAFALVILDESHYVKNAATGRARLVRDKLQRVPRRLVISGTPVMNTPEEIRAQLAFLHPEEWSDGAWFRERFEEPFEEGSPEVRDAVLRRLRQFLDGVMIRREKATALPDLPPKSIMWHRVKLAGEARRAYVALEDEFADTFAKDAAKATGRLERLKQSALAGKMPQAIAFLRGIIANGEKVVVFSRYRDALASLEKELADAHPVTLTGDTSPEERAEAERRFEQDAACRVFLGQLVAAGTAITLVAGTHAAFLDLSWNPADHRQAMDRIHRRGQTRPVTAHFFLAEDTVDEDIARVLDEKGRMMDQLLAPTFSADGARALRGATRLVGERLLSRRSSLPAPRP